MVFASQNVGSYLLKDLKSPPVPESVSWFPETIGWQIIALVLLVLIAFSAYKRINKWWRNRYRNEAIQAIKQFDINQQKHTLNGLHQVVLLTLNYAFSKNSKGHFYGKHLVGFMQQTLSKGNVALDTKLLTQWQHDLVTEEFSHWQINDIQTLQQEIISWLKYHSCERSKC